MIDLNNISEEQLLKTRLCDLPISIEGTWLKDCVEALYAELDSKGLAFHPECYLADEWLTPEGNTVIGIPFYLAHPVLLKLEHKMMLEAEGEGKSWCMQLLRHEAGHAFSYAYDLHKRKDWQKVFGSSEETTYGDTYKFKPYSKSYVRHLDGFYAQYHPDEDFVETFAVWLTPNSNWMQTYQGWKALSKLQFVDHLMSEIKGKPSVSGKKHKLWSQKKSKITLEKYYRRKKASEQEEYLDFYDVQLNKIFKSLSQEEWLAFNKERRKNKNLLSAENLIRQYSKNLLNSVDRCTGERKYIINDLLKNISLRAKQLNMIVTGDPTNAMLQLSVYVTSLTLNYMHTGWYRGNPKRK
jgi:hypothetical protein